MASVLIMGTGLRLEIMQLPDATEESTQVACCQHCWEQGDQQEEDERNDGHDCYPGCGCGCFQLTVFDFQFMILPGIPVQHYEYGAYINSYHFEFSTPHFEPPRLG